MWCYVQSNGKLSRDGECVGQGYAGAKGPGKNNPLMQAVKSTGPIPRGWWTIVGPPADTASHGPFVMRLEPRPETQTFGRSGFLMHGDNMSDPGNGSEGCIVMARQVREYVWNSGDRDLLVVATDVDVPEIC